MSISPLISGFGFTIGFGNIGPSSSNGGHLKSLPFKGGVQASAGGVTGAVPHMVKKNSGSISSLFIKVLTITHLFIILSFIFISV